MLICKYCRNKISENSQICPNCKLVSTEYSKHNSVSSLIQKIWLAQQSHYLKPNVNFLEGVTLGFKHYFNFKGRSSIAEYWWWSLFRYGGILMLVPLPIGGSVGLAPYMTLLFFMFTLIPDFAVASRRLHDINKSGLWLLIFLWVPTPITILIFKGAHKSGNTGRNLYGINPREYSLTPNGLPESSINTYSKIS